MLPDKDWVCLLLVKGKPKTYIDEVISKIILHNVGWLCTVGDEAEWVHDYVDEEISYRNAEVEDLYLPPHLLITTWHQDLQEAIWYSLFMANSDKVDLKEVIILDISGELDIPTVKTYLEKLKMKESGDK
ncbi:DUF7684 family protein [Sabulibacter ruber]|uniref:DUF7684 family protein n=1 Tax=Sabulibacter ruber TaxID=2811901 RepID=UPI001A969E3C|nr:hypothetical protein [Sabulibacter ruber]